jgi:hypothetical protein
LHSDLKSSQSILILSANRRRVIPPDKNLFHRFYGERHENNPFPCLALLAGFEK